MKTGPSTLLLALLVTVVLGFKTLTDESRYVVYKPDLTKVALALYWKNDSAQIIRSLGNLKAYTQQHGQKLVFAMNAGMYMTDNSPLGLFIEKGKTVRGLNVAKATGNFYLKPNGVFFITRNNKTGICRTEDWDRTNRPNAGIQYATQSGPMLVIDSAIHPAFKEGSTNLHIRNGVGILPNGNPVFIMSKQAVSFYDFALQFQKMGCKQALYLDGFVSRTYLPEKNWVQTDGNFGVIIGGTLK
jgi:uncharacterized protein YigE (DUF2233 family)